MKGRDEFESIGYWGHDRSDLSVDVLLVKKQDLDDLQGYIDEGLVKRPQEILCVVPASYTAIDVLSYYLKYRRSPNCNVIGAPRDLVLFFGVWERICASVSRESVRLVDGLLESIPRQLIEHAPGCMQALELTRWVLDDFRNRIMSVNSIYGDYSPKSSGSRWWNRAAPGIDTIREMIARYSVGRDRPDSLEAVLSWLDRSVTELRRLNSSGLSDSLFAASSYCYMTAEIVEEREEYLLATSLWHRCLDFFLQAICTEHRLIMDTAEGLRFSGQGRREKGDKPGLASCYLELVRSGTYLHDAHLKKMIFDANEIRNNLISTHSVYGVSQARCQIFRDAVIRILGRLDAAKARSMQHRASVVNRKIPLHPSLLFCLDTDLELGFRPLLPNDV